MKYQLSDFRYQISAVSLKVFLLLVFLFPCFQFSAYSADCVSSSELIEKAKEFDGKEVVYKGEIVVAILDRGEHSWVNVNDGTSAIGVWCRTVDLEGVKFIGDYKNKGDIVEIHGIFHRACPVHGGELDIHARDIRIVKNGFHVREKVDSEKINFSIAIFLAMALFAFIFRKRL